MFKYADLGGEGNDSSFEQAFSSIAHSYVREKAPTLMDYELGFQLLDKNDDGSRAVGILAFKVGGKLIYIPLFWLSGEVKGHELMYLQGSDVFLPLQEGWINKILNTRQFRVGDSTEKSTFGNGVRQPRLQDLSSPPMSKWGSTIDPDILPGMCGLAWSILNNKESKKIDIPLLIKNGSTKMLGVALEYCKRYPIIAQAFETHYNITKLAKQILDDTKVSNQPWDRNYNPPTPKTSLQVIYSNELTKIANLTTPQREQLVSNGYLILDKRAEESVTKAYKVMVEAHLENPIKTGIYDVLVTSGKFEKCLVLMHPKTHNGHMHGCTIITMSSGTKSYLNAHASKVWVKAKSDDNNDSDEFSAYKTYYDSLPVADSLPKTSNDDYAYDKYLVLINSKGQGTCPFRVNKYSNNAEDSKTYKVHFKDYLDVQPSRGHSDYHCHPSLHDSYSSEAITLTDDNTSDYFEYSSRGLDCGKGVKLLKLYDDGVTTYDANKVELLLGDPTLIKNLIYEKTAMLKVASDGTEILVNNNRLTPIGAIVNLVKEIGLREDSAREIVKEAQKSGIVKMRIKAAAGPYDLLMPQVSAPSIPEPTMGYSGLTDSIPTQDSQFEMLPVDYPPQPDPYAYDITREIEPQTSANDAQSMMQAAQSGQKEILDATSLTSLMRSSTESSMIRRHLPDLKTSLDKLGRLLFSMYWHGDEWQEKFGQADMPAIEDLIKSTLDNMGELILELETKDVGANSGIDQIFDTSDSSSQ